jgi:ABC-type amino acid transport substrate-binding protein
MMKRSAARALLVLVALIVISACGSSSNSSHSTATNAAGGTKALKPLIVGTSGALAPYLYQNAQHQWVGLSADVLNYVLPKLGYKPVYQSMAFESLIPAVTTGRVDITTNIYDTPAREATLDYVDFFGSPFGVMTLAKSAHAIHSWSDLCGKTLASVIASTIKDTIDQYNKAHCPGNPVHNATYSGTEAEVIGSMVAGHAVGVIDDVGLWEYDSAQNHAYAVALKSVGAPYKWAIAFKKGSPLGPKLLPYVRAYVQSPAAAAAAKSLGLDPHQFIVPGSVT